jgi:RNA polymerase sigma-70 factor (ECF subfamily)
MTWDAETITDIPESSADSGAPHTREDATTSSRVGGQRHVAEMAVTGSRFEDVVLPHLDAAHRLSRWLLRNEHDAEDAVQEASLRAFRYFRTFAGGDGRAWFLRIVRNTCSGSRDHRVEALTDTFDEEQHSDAGSTNDPEVRLLQMDDATLVARALRTLSPRVRRLLELRELKGLSYRELAGVMNMPMGTVMSSLSRARQALRQALHSELHAPAAPDEAYAVTEYPEST